jgi:hypothetical protein
MWRTLFGAAARRRPPSRRFTPALEQLADRIVPALSFTFVGGVLTITSDIAGDAAAVTTAANGDILLNGVATGADVTTATSISVLGNGGADILDLSGLTGYSNPVTIDGGAGADTVIGSAGADTILGGGAGAAAATTSCATTPAATSSSAAPAPTRSWGRPRPTISSSSSRTRGS